MGKLSEGCNVSPTLLLTLLQGSQSWLAIVIHSSKSAVILHARTQYSQWYKCFLKHSQSEINPQQ